MNENDRKIAEAIKNVGTACIEQAIRLAATTTVVANGHPQIDAPTLVDMRVAIVKKLTAYLEAWNAKSVEEMAEGK